MQRATPLRIVMPLACILAGVAGLVALGPVQQRGPAFKFEKIADNVYFAVGTGALTVFCNAAIIINENDVLIVDTHVSPEAAQALLTELKTLTNKPVRYVVNTHFHFDHSGGNQVYGPDVELIGHDVTREKLADGSSLRGAGYARSSARSRLRSRACGNSGIRPAMPLRKPGSISASPCRMS